MVNARTLKEVPIFTAPAFWGLRMTSDSPCTGTGTAEVQKRLAGGRCSAECTIDDLVEGPKTGGDEGSGRKCDVGNTAQWWMKTMDVTFLDVNVEHRTLDLKLNGGEGHLRAWPRWLDCFSS